MMGGATRACGDDGGAGAGEAGDAMDAGGLDGFGQRHGRQDGGETTGEHRLARSRRPQEQCYGQNARIAFSVRAPPRP
jgi:hypothetical protein